jgi:hypothetical protein
VTVAPNGLYCPPALPCDTGCASSASNLSEIIDRSSIASLHMEWQSARELASRDIRPVSVRFVLCICSRVAPSSASHLQWERVPLRSSLSTSICADHDFRKVQTLQRRTESQ